MTKNDGKGSVRQRMAADAEKDYETLMGSIRAALDAEITKQGKCSCGKWVAVTFDDVKARTAAAQLWLDQGFGKPTQNIAVDVDVSLEADLARWHGYLERMTDDERAVMVGFLQREVALQAALPVGA